MKSGTTQYQIAQILQVSARKICRGLKRNIGKAGCGVGESRAKNAHRRTLLRHREKPKAQYFTESIKKRCVHLLTVKKWSPEFISAMEGFEDYFVSHETICKCSGHVKKVIVKIKENTGALYTSQEKGSFEKRIGILKRFIPKELPLRTRHQ